MAKADRGIYLEDGTWKASPKGLTGKERQRTDAPGRGPSKTGYNKLQKGKMDPIAELQDKILSQLLADRPGDGPGYKQLNNHMNKSGDPDEAIKMKVLSQLLGGQGDGWVNGR